VRARDVQILFADASSGARSPALVRQGQISEIINAKPQSRRRILEEAAGITGLHVRRHEAELKLKGAETNLSRIDDVIGQLDTQLQGLKRQARQAIRYKELAGAIRRLEAAQLHLAWTAAVEAAAHEEAQLDEAVRRLAERTRAASEAGRARDAAAEALPPLREDEMVRAAVLQRVSAEQANLDREMAQAQRRKAEIEARAEQIGQDLRHEKEILNDVDAVLARLKEEDAALRRPRPARSRPAAEAAEVLAGRPTSSGRRKAQRATRPRPGCRSSAPSAAKVSGASKSSASAWHGSKPSLRPRRAPRRPPGAIGRRGRRGRTPQSAGCRAGRAPGSRVRGAEAEQAHRAALADLETQRQAYDDARREAEKLATEVRTLTKLLGVGASDLWPPLVDAVKVAAGYEAALAAALGDDIEAPANEASPVHWRSLPPLDAAVPLPPEAELLSNHVEAPAALARAVADRRRDARAGGGAPAGLASRPAAGQPRRRPVALGRLCRRRRRPDRGGHAAGRAQPPGRSGGGGSFRPGCRRRRPRQAFEAARQRSEAATARDRRRATA
jgi:chromosome segregation protein